MQKNRAVKIANPAGGTGFTSRKSAERMVGHGRAKWVAPDTISFDVGHRQHLAAVSSAVLTGPNYDRASHSGCATPRELRNLPMVGDVMRLFRGAA